MKAEIKVKKVNTSGLLILLLTITLLIGTGLSGNSPVGKILIIVGGSLATLLGGTLGLLKIIKPEIEGETVTETAISTLKRGEVGQSLVKIRSPILRLMRPNIVKLETDEGIHIINKSIAKTGDTFLANFSIKGDTGLHILGPLYLKAWLGGDLIEIEMEIPLTLSVKILPEIPKTTPMRYETRKLIDGIVLTRRKGRGVEFLSVREYVPGDDISRIDWKGSLRSGNLIIKEFEKESLETLGIVIVLSDSNFTGRRPSYPIMADYVLALANSLLVSGLKLRMAIVTERGYLITEECSGRRDLYRISEALGSIEWPKEIVISSSPLKIASWLVLEKIASLTKGPLLIFAEITRDEEMKALERMLQVSTVIRHSVLIFLYTPELLRLIKGELEENDLQNLRSFLESSAALTNKPRIEILPSRPEDVAHLIAHEVII